MKLILIHFTNNAMQQYGRTAGHTCRPIVLFVWLDNPTTYKGNTFVWQQGRKLVSGTMNGQSFTYRYDGNGMRYKKIVGASKTDYYYNGTQLLLENRNGIRLYYIYGVTGIEGMIYRGEYYYYDKNTLGDIIAIRDDNGNVIARYSYDAWGNHKVYGKNGAVDRSKTSIGNVNPFRYRGYYYDTETGFYYLQTRYYDPTICRFINADNYELVAELSQTIGQLNLYAYANNNPIMLTDETGEGVLTALLVGALIGALVGATTYTASELISYKKTGEWSWSWSDFAGAAIGGGIGGGLSAFGLGAWAVGIGGAASSAIGMSLQNAFEGGKNSIEYIVLKSLSNAVFSMIGYKIMGGIKISGINAGRGSYSAVSQQIMTKLKRNTISKISLKTLSKMYIADFCGSALDIVQGVYGG